MRYSPRTVYLILKKKGGLLFGFLFGERIREEYFFALRIGMWKERIGGPINENIHYPILDESAGLGSD